METIDPQVVQVGDRLRFDGKATSWLVRAESADRRWLIATSSMFGNVYYAILDREKGIRGPMNVIGHGLGICTTSGPDPAIDDAMSLLEGRGHDEDCDCGAFACDIVPGTYEVSRRADQPLVISTRVPVT